jgi:HK97 family phage major capsid protein
MSKYEAQVDELIELAEKLADQNTELRDRLADLEQKFNHAGDPALYRGEPRFDLAKAVTESDAFKSLLSGVGKSARISIKTAIINATGASQPLVAADRLAGIVHGAERRFHMRDLLAVNRTQSNTIEFAKESVFENNAGPQVGGSPEAFENVTKPESGITFTLASAAVTTLAHWIPVSKQVLSDSPMLASYLNNRLLYGLKLKEDTQILLGTGANGQLPGLYTNRTAYSVASPVAYTSKLDILMDAIGQVQASDYEPNGIVINSVDWKQIRLAKDSYGRYLVGDPQSAVEPRLWGLPVVVSNSMTAGSFLVGAFDMAAELWDRQDATIEIGYTDSQFVRNMVSILCEERIGLTIYRTAALVGGSFTVA